MTIDVNKYFGFLHLTSTPLTMPPPLETLRRQYFALVPPYLLHIPPPQLLAENQEWLVSNLITTRYPPESSYRRQFWRKLLPQIEASIPDGDEDQVVRLHTL